MASLSRSSREGSVCGRQWLRASTPMDSGTLEELRLNKYGDRSMLIWPSPAHVLQKTRDRLRSSYERDDAGLADSEAVNVPFDGTSSLSNTSCCRVLSRTASVVPGPSRSSHDWVRSYLDITFRETDAASSHARDATVGTLPGREPVDHKARLQGGYVSQILLVAHQMQGNFKALLDSVYLSHATVDSNSCFSKRNKENEQDHDN
ncbi:hypothetical protein LA080_006349 [Diaporthe eres]|nr:hypothetical protein LA080_006349 [Diaporthe eres]